MKFPAFKKRQEIINSSLKNYFSDNKYPPKLYEAMKYSLFSGGKRLRSVLCLFCFELFKESYEEVIPAAIAIEFVHTYSLIHDDLPAIDNDDLRRGKLTCHKKYGEDIAILAGDALFAEAFKSISTLQKGSAGKINRVTQVLADATGASGMVGGQVMDILSEESEVSKETLDYIHLNKTGKLIRAAALIGGILGDAAENKLKVISDYSLNLGLCFQITDDILDLTKTTEELGKPALSDKRLKKATFPAVYGLEKARAISVKYRDAAIDIIKDIDKKGNLRALARYVNERPN